MCGYRFLVGNSLKRIFNLDDNAGKPAFYPLSLSG